MEEQLVEGRLVAVELEETDPVLSHQNQGHFAGLTQIVAVEVVVEPSAVAPAPVALALLAEA